MEKIERNSYYFLANKADIPSINKRGFKKSDEQIRISDETIYLTTDRLNAQETPLISPNELEVVLLRHQETKKLTDKAQLVSVALEYQKLGQDIPKYEMETMSVEKYNEVLKARQAKMNIQGVDNRINTESDVKVNINEEGNKQQNLKALAIRLLNARSAGDRNTLVAILETMKNNPEFAEVFDNSGKLSFQKLFELAGTSKEELERSGELHIPKEKEKEEKEERTQAQDFAIQANSREVAEKNDVERIEDNIEKGQDVSDRERDFYKQNSEKSKNPFELSDEDKTRINENSRIIAQKFSSETKHKTQEEREGFEEHEM